jgi:hypothetical protein
MITLEHEFIFFLIAMMLIVIVGVLSGFVVSGMLAACSM